MAGINPNITLNVNKQATQNAEIFTLHKMRSMLLSRRDTFFGVLFSKAFEKH